jgi:hypothetical protein
MGKSKADVTVHVDETLARERLGEICHVLEGTTGVMKAQCADHKPHLLIVEYDPDAVDSKAILDRVTGQGLHAELIGM